jgi:hypothetical protein
LKYRPIKHRCVTTKLEKVSYFDQIFQNKQCQQVALDVRFQY